MLRLLHTLSFIRSLGHMLITFDQLCSLMRDMLSWRFFYYFTIINRHEHIFLLNCTGISLQNNIINKDYCYLPWPFNKILWRTRFQEMAKQRQLADHLQGLLYSSRTILSLIIYMMSDELMSDKKWRRCCQSAHHF